MSLRETMQLHLADKAAAWTDEGATWIEGGARQQLILVHEPLAARHVIEAHVQALASGSALTLAYTGPATPVARRTAAELGVKLVEEAEVAPTPPALPWGDAPSAPEPAAIEVDALELASMPWHAMDDGQHEMLPAGRAHRFAPARPTLASDWGLPWPRQAPPADAIARADPALWNATQRLDLIREDLVAQGAPSFGAVKSDAPHARRPSERL